MKEILKNIFIILSKMVMPIFYQKKYLKGKWFDRNIKGWKWAWRCLFMQKIIGYNRFVPWPVSHRTEIGNPDNIFFDVNDINNFQHFGCYFQSQFEKIIIGKGTYIAPNVGLITSNHDINSLDKHLEGKPVIIGEKCWIGMNSVVLPGVELGDNTIVGAGSIVTKSFIEGNCVIAGNPAKIIKKI
jgi:acetyltransferase-like isoleucine patch superfamily enzyme